MFSAGRQVSVPRTCPRGTLLPVAFEFSILFYPMEGDEAIHHRSEPGGTNLFPLCVETNSRKPEFGIGTKWNKLGVEELRKLLRMWWPGTASNSITHYSRFR